MLHANLFFLKIITNYKFIYKKIQELFLYCYNLKYNLFHNLFIIIKFNDISFCKFQQNLSFTFLF